MKLKIFCLALAMTITSSLLATTPQEILNLIGTSPQFEILSQQNNHEVALSNLQNQLDGPEIEFDYLWGENQSRKISFGITQNFEWFGAYRIRNKIVENTKNTVLLTQAQSLMEMKYEASRLLVKLMYCKKRIEMMSEIHSNLQLINTSLDDALEYGMITILDKKKSGLELATLSISIERLKKEQVSLTLELEQLTGSKIDIDQIDWEAMATMFQIHEYEYYIEKAKIDPAFLIEKSKRYGAELVAKEAKMTTLPGVGIGYRYEREENINFHGFSVSLNLPTWGISKARKASQYLINAATISETNQYNINLNRIEKEYKTACELRNELQILKKQGFDGSYVALLKETHEGGEISLLQLLIEQGYYRDATLQLLEIEEEYALLLASLNRYDNI